MLGKPLIKIIEYGDVLSNKDPMKTLQRITQPFCCLPFPPAARVSFWTWQTSFVLQAPVLSWTYLGSQWVLLILVPAGPSERDPKGIPSFHVFSLDAKDALSVHPSFIFKRSETWMAGYQCVGNLAVWWSPPCPSQDQAFTSCNLAALLLLLLLHLMLPLLSTLRGLEFSRSCHCWGSPLSLPPSLPPLVCMCSCVCVFICVCSYGGQRASHVIPQYGPHIFFFFLRPCILQSCWL